MECKEKWRKIRPCCTNVGKFHCFVFSVSNCLISCVLCCHVRCYACDLASSTYSTGFSALKFMWNYTITCHWLHPRYQKIELPLCYYINMASLRSFRKERHLTDKCCYAVGFYISKFFIIIYFRNQNRDNTFYKLIWWLLGEHSPVMSWWGLLQWRVLFLNSSDQLAIFFLISCCWKVVLLSDVTVCWDDALFFDGVFGCWFLSRLWQRALSDRRAGRIK
jgi:hypothetical protein